ncbi:MAG: hypothetical protein ACLU3I_08270 [Acutalibacteraceae bacterium]
MEKARLKQLQRNARYAGQRSCVMDRTQKLVIEIDPQRATVVLKQEILGDQQKGNLPGGSVSRQSSTQQTTEFVHFKRSASEGIALRRGSVRAAQTVLPALPAALCGHHLP